MFCMSETEKLEQIGRLVEEYSHLKGKLNHVNEKITQAQSSYQLAGQNFNAIRFDQNGRLTIAIPQYGNQPRPLEHLLSTAELEEVLHERERLNSEVNATALRLRGLAPHLL